MLRISQKLNIIILQLLSSTHYSHQIKNVFYFFYNHSNSFQLLNRHPYQMLNSQVFFLNFFLIQNVRGFCCFFFFCGTIDYCLHLNHIIEHILAVNKKNGYNIVFLPST